MNNSPVNSENLSSGAFLVSRSLFDSDIWFMPPEYIKIWFYLFGKANHSGRKYHGFFCERGQYFCDYKELRDQLKYKIGYRSKQYNENHMKNLMKYLRSTQRITTMKKPRGILITIVNYDVYQNLKSYEKTNEETNVKTSCKPTVNQIAPSINKNCKELNKYSLLFDERWLKYPNKDGRKEALKHFLATVKTDEDLKDFDRALENYLDHLKIENWKRPKNGKTFFNNWGDWVTWVEPVAQRDDRVVL